MQKVLTWINTHKVVAALLIMLLILIVVFIFFEVWRKRLRLKETQDKMNQDYFNTATNLIIDNLEGGYFDQSMFNDFRLPNATAAVKQIYANSGETMYGIDRKNGGSINTSAAGTQFWYLIDNATPPKTKWRWNDKADGTQVAPNLMPQLKPLVVQMMQPLYEDFSSSFLSTESIDLIEQDQRLLLHFIYACWNGEGYFKQWAGEINDAVKNGTTDLDALAAIALQQRTGSKEVIISEEGPKITQLFTQLKPTQA